MVYPSSAVVHRILVSGLSVHDVLLVLGLLALVLCLAGLLSVLGTRSARFVAQVQEQRHSAVEVGPWLQRPPLWPVSKPLPCPILIAGQTSPMFHCLCLAVVLQEGRKISG